MIMPQGYLSLLGLSIMFNQKKNYGDGTIFFQFFAQILSLYKKLNRPWNLTE